MKQITKEKKWFLFLLFFTMCFTVKNIFVGADIDEGYGVMVGYRLAKGDRLLLEMWEPHQTSAIFTAVLIRPFLWLRKGNLDFLNIYLRICYFLVQGCITVFLYRTIRTCTPQTDKNSAALIALLYYVTSPKHIYIPEYSNLQIWFTVLLMLCLLRFFCDRTSNRRLPKQKWLWLLLAGCFLTCDVLAYPSMVLLYPCCVLLLFFKRGKQDKTKQTGWKEAVVFTLPCLLGAVLFFAMLLQYLSPAQLKELIPVIITQDASHSVTVTEKCNKLVLGFGKMACYILGCGLAAAGITAVLVRKRFGVEKQKKKITGKPARYGKLYFWGSWLIVQSVMQLGIWLFGKESAMYPQVGYLTVAVSGLFFAIKDKKQAEAGFWMTLLGLINYVGILLFSNWEPYYLGGFLLPACLGGCLCWYTYFTEEKEKTEAEQKAEVLQKTESGQKAKSGQKAETGQEAEVEQKAETEQEREAGQETEKRLFQAAMLCFFLSVVVGHTYRIIGGEADSSLLDVRGYNHEGFRKGIFVPYMNAYRYNSNAEIWKEAVPEGSSVLYVGPSQFFCMLGDCVVASPSTISSPTYEENLLEYWEWNPERYPDEVVIECWYGDVEDMEEYAYLLNWLEQEYHPASIEDYPYIKVYRRNVN